jgi:UbiD family decarboxylase
MTRNKRRNEFSGLEEFLNLLHRSKEIVTIEKTVSPKYEIAAIVSRLDKGKAVLFESIKNNKLRVTANILGTRKRIALAIDARSEDHIDERINVAVSRPITPKSSQDVIWKKKARNLFDLPIVTHFEKDFGPYITSSLVFVQNQETESQNLSTHRLLRLNDTFMVIRMVEGRHLHKCYSYAKEHGEDLRVSIIIGAHPAISIASAYQASYGEDELGIANALMGGRLLVTKAPLSGLQVPSRSEILMEGRILLDQAKSESMVEMLRTYDMKRIQPVFQLDRIYYRDQCIYHDILPGYSEHRLLMGIPIESRIHHAVKNVVPTTENVHLTDGGCNWLHAVIQIKKRLEGEPKNAILAAFAAHPSLKMAIVVDDDIDPKDPIQVEYAIATRCQADRDLIIVRNAKGSSLDPSSDQENLLTTKLGIDATVSKFKEKGRFEIARIPGLEKTKLSYYL